MPREPRIVLPGIPHHITQRGSRKGDTFLRTSDYEAYLDVLAIWAPRLGVQIWDYCLMPNHVHILAVPDHERSLSSLFWRVARQHSHRINKREDWSGALWQSRFHSVPMDEVHALSAIRYVLRNPVEAGIARVADEWPHSSARARVRRETNPILTSSPLHQSVRCWATFLDEASDTLRIRKHRGPSDHT